jgi:hypothetical protein
VSDDRAHKVFSQKTLADFIVPATAGLEVFLRRTELLVSARNLSLPHSEAPLPRSVVFPQTVRMWFGRPYLQSQVLLDAGFGFEAEHTSEEPVV